MSVPKIVGCLLAFALLGAFTLLVCAPRWAPTHSSDALRDRVAQWRVQPTAAGQREQCPHRIESPGPTPASYTESARRVRQDIIQNTPISAAYDSSSPAPSLTTIPPVSHTLALSDATAPDDDLLLDSSWPDAPADPADPATDPESENSTTQPLFAPPPATQPHRVPPHTLPPHTVPPHTLPPHTVPPNTASPHAAGPHTLPAPDVSPEPIPGQPDAVAEDPHAAVFAKNMYPSAQECRQCHEAIYEEWASSSHAYAAVSPMFHKFEQTMTDLTKGTVGYFCMRCHSPVGTTVGHPRDASIWDAIPAAREGVTCIVCHRVKYNYTKSDGERRIEPGSIYDPVYGAGYGETLSRVLNQKDHYKVLTSPNDKGPGQAIHTGVIHFEQITTSHVCAPCHQVAVEPGVKLEVVWEQYRASPACKMGISCQDCHMGLEPGLPVGYAQGPVAVVGGKPIDPHRKRSNHLFYGPGYSILHPGLFPWNPKADAWSPDAWLQFDYRAGWGTEAFESRLAAGELQVAFPPAWIHADDRRDAREIVDANLKKLAGKMRMRRRLMENTSRVEGPVFLQRPAAGQDLNVQYLVKNLNNGHNLPSGSLGAQPQVWLNVSLVGPRGNHLWESGYVDRNGDLADLHSLEVAAGRILADQQLFNLQTKFLITHVKGPDREMYLPVNVDFDQLPFLRPSPFPVKVMNHPPFVRMEAHSIAPLGSRVAKYTIPGHLLTEPGTYQLSVRMRSRAEPIYFMRFCGATPEMERAMNEWMLDFHENCFQFVIH